MADTPRAVALMDLDAFFASVEVLEKPELAGKPVVVGGRPEGRGVVVAASYPARAFGVHSAMPMARAVALCPQLVVVPPRHRVYWEYSKRVMAILREASPLVEQMSIDEAYLDLTDQVTAWDEAVEMAQRLQARVGEEVGLSASIGLAINKLVAKVAAGQHKPGGLTVVRPGEEAAFLAPLAVRELPGVGPVTEQRLAELQVKTIGELAQVGAEELRKRFGRTGGWLARGALGIDNSPVVTEHGVGSIGHETTFNRDLADLEALHEQLWQLCQGVGRRLKKSELAAGTVAIKLRYSDFTTLTRQMSLAVATDADEEIYRAAQVLLDRNWRRGRPVRLLGVSAHNLSAPVGQLPLL
jgi:DNA polymerase IV